jgi:molybdopterin synthase sulfur carrier subunit
MFAVARQMVGREVVELQLPAAATVRQLRAALTAEVPALASLMPHLMFALNAEYASDDAVIPAGAEIACIPPVSGG